MRSLITIAFWLLFGLAVLSMLSLACGCRRRVLPALRSVDTLVMVRYDTVRSVDTLRQIDTLFTTVRVAHPTIPAPITTVTTPLVLPLHLLKARSEVGVREERPNSSPIIDRWLRAVGARPGDPWCAAFVSAMLTEGGVKSPSYRSALARGYIGKGKTIHAADVLSGRVTIPAGSLVIWQHGHGISGHIGIVNNRWKGPTGTTVEGNTSPTNAGSQRNGDVVALKTRTIHLGSAFRITDFVLVK